ncbi:MAG: ABC transporter ATP-binding protein [Flavobacteriales bacterium]|nr:ABC transporter ATP-binding protein [Flavobacteriales bacterium]
MIRIEHLSKRFGNLEVLKDIHTSFGGGKIVTIIGHNGSGKTTLIKCILGMVIPDSGNIYYNDSSILTGHHYRSEIGYMPQIGHYPDNMKVGQIFEMLKDLRHNGRILDEELLEAYELKSIFNKPLRTLSGGTTQKVSAAIAYLFDPAVLILDEPTAGLDPLASEILKAKTLKARNAGKLILITSHLLSEVEELSDNIVYLYDGMINFHSTIEELKERTGEKSLSKAIARIMKGGNLA